MMNRKQKILKAVLLLRKINRNKTKEEEIRFVEEHYTDEDLDKWISLLKEPEEECNEDYSEEYDEDLHEDSLYEDNYLYISSCTAGDYSPSNPWDAPGMSIRDFI